MKLTPGQRAPDFDVTDIHGQPVRLSDFSGKKLFLAFYRYAACPLCNLRVHELSLRAAEFENAGLSLVAVFESSDESIRKRVGKQDLPFPVVGDPNHSLYDAYGVETSMGGFMAGMVSPKMVKAFSKGFLPGKIEGEVARMPADFLIGPDLKISDVCYGGTMASHMPIETVEAFARK